MWKRTEQQIYTELQIAREAFEAESVDKGSKMLVHLQRKFNELLEEYRRRTGERVYSCWYNSKGEPPILKIAKITPGGVARELD